MNVSYFTYSFSPTVQLIPKCVPRTKEHHRQPVHPIEFRTMHTGNYSFRLRASSFAGNGSWTEPQFLFVEQPLVVPPGSVTQKTLLAVVFSLLGVFFVLVGLFAWWKKPW